MGELATESGCRHPLFPIGMLFGYTLFLWPCPALFLPTRLRNRVSFPKKAAIFIIQFTRLLGIKKRLPQVECDPWYKCMPGRNIIVVHSCTRRAVPRFTFGFGRVELFNCIDPKKRRERKEEEKQFRERHRLSWHTGEATAALHLLHHILHLLHAAFA